MKRNNRKKKNMKKPRKAKQLLRQKIEATSSVDESTEVLLLDETGAPVLRPTITLFEDKWSKEILYFNKHF